MIKFKCINRNEITQIKSQWEQLNQLHLDDSHYFKEHYETFTFEERINKLMSRNESDVRIECACNDKDKIVGYCISSINASSGEIDSLFVEKEVRGQNIGRQLVDNAIEWLNTKNCSKIIVTVAEGHESVFGFYQNIGFYPRLTTLELK